MPKVDVKAAVRKPTPNEGTARFNKQAPISKGRQEKGIDSDDHLSDNDDDDDDASQGLQLQALMKAVQNQSKNQSRASVITKKINGFADAALAQLAELQEEAAGMTQEIEAEIDRMEAEETDEDWQAAAALFGVRTQSVRGVIEGLDKLLETNGPQRAKAIDNISHHLETNPEARSKSRKRLMKQAQGHLTKGIENQKLATDAKALIKGYKALLRT